jgi:hypothetical protein
VNVLLEEVESDSKQFYRNAAGSLGFGSHGGTKRVSNARCVVPLLFAAYATLGMLESLDREGKAPTWTQSKKGCRRSAELDPLAT